jgi:hypothetical protein
MHAGLDRFFGLAMTLRQAQIRRLPDTSALLDVYLRSRKEELYPAPPPRPDRRVVRSFRLDRFEFEHTSFASAHEPLHPDARDRYQASHAPLHRFHVRSVRVRRRAARRALVYLHPWMLPGPLVNDYILAPRFAERLGCDVFALEHPHHGRRQLAGSPYGGALYLTSDLVMTAEAIRQSISDTRTVVQHLRELGTYDEIGVSGISLGGGVVITVACVEPRIDWAVPIIGCMDIADAIEQSALLAGVRRGLARSGVTLDVARALDKALFGGLAPVIARERMLIIGAQQDHCVRAARIRKQLAAWPGVRSLWLAGGHFTCGPELLARLHDVRAFLDSLPRAA